MKKTTLVCLITIGLIGCAQIGKMVGGLLTGSTANLKELSMIAQHVSNIYPPDIGVTAADYFPEGTMAGDNYVAMTFLKRDGVGLAKVDGQVTMDGAPVGYVGVGSYLQKTERVAKEISIMTTSGQQATFTLKPQLPIKIKSIAGGSNEVDRNSDLVLELENPAGHENTFIRVALMMDLVGVTDFAELGHYRSADKIVIKKEEFLHPSVIDGIAGGIRDGESYLLVERYTMSNKGPKEFGAVQFRSVYFDIAKVNVSEEPEDVISGAVVYEDINGFQVDVSKPNAYTGKPISSAKKFAIASFSVRATKLKQVRTSTSTSSSSYYSGGYKYTTTTTVTTTRTRKFPQVPKEHWDGLTAELYEAFVKELKSVYNIELIPIEQVTSSENYKLMFPIEEKMSEAEYTGTYGGTKTLIPTTMGEIIGSASSTFAADRPDARLIDELGVDGIISVTIDFEMPWFDDTEEMKLNPRMAFRITGPAFGYNFGPIVYAQGVIAGAGAEFDGENLSYDFLQKTIRKDELMNAFGKSFNKLRQVEQKLGYTTIWGNRDF